LRLNGSTPLPTIAIPDVLELLSRSLFNSLTYNQSFDIGGPDILTYREMLLGYAEAKNLKDGFDCSVMTLNYHLIGCTSSPQLHINSLRFSKQYAC
jgi:hypothetical protein